MIKRKPFEGLSSLYKRLKDQRIKETYMDEKSTLNVLNVSWLMNVLLCSLQIGFEVGLPTP